MIIDTTPLSWEKFNEGIARLMAHSAETVAAQQVPAPVAAPEQPKPVAPQAPWYVRLGNFLSNRARDLALVLIILGTFVAVFQGSLTSATLFGFSGLSAIAFALMPDALMIISAAKMRETSVSPVQRREAKISMYFSLAFSLLSNMIAALYITMPELFTAPVLVAGAVSYHGMIVIFLWRAVETSTKTRHDAPSARLRRPAPPKAQAPKGKAVTSKNAKAPAKKTQVKA